MASACRATAAMVGRRSLCGRPNSIIKSLSPNQKSSAAGVCSSPTTPFPLAASRFAASMLGSLETMLPLHSRIAAARLKSNIATDTTCWSWLSQEFAIPR